MKFVLLLIVAIFVMILVRCDYNVVWAEGKYKVLQIDVEDNSLLCYSVGEDACLERMKRVVGMGANDRYLSIYACPSENCEFYFLEKKMDSEDRSQDAVVNGPYSEVEFEKLISETGLPTIIMF